MCAGDGHTEAVRVEYDPGVVSFEELLDTYWTMYSGCHGSVQYRSAIWYESEGQKEAALKSLEERKESNPDEAFLYADRAISVEPAKPWHDAEAYHQHYVRGGHGKSSSSDELFRPCD